MEFQYNDGGREATGFKGSAGDCVTRSIAIAASMDYRTIYDLLADGNARQRGKATRSARNGVNVKRKWFKDCMSEWGFKWTATMFIGSGCKVHLVEDELPAGRLVVSVSKHYTAVIDGVVHDTDDPQRETYCARPNDGTLEPGEWVNPGNNMICKIERRCVYGYWKFME